jgi:hypothetical protein
VRHIGLHRLNERSLFVPFEELDVDGLPAAHPGGEQPMHSVDYAHGRTVHDNRWQPVLGFRQYADVFLVDSV